MPDTSALDLRLQCRRTHGWMGWVLWGVLAAHTASAQPATPAPRCQGGICLEEAVATLTPSDIQALKKLYLAEEQPSLPFTEVRLKGVILESVYLLTARKPNYYGVHIVVSKEGAQWSVLKKVRFVE